MKPSYFNFKDKTVFLPGTKTDTSAQTIKIDDYTANLFKRLIIEKNIPINEFLFNNSSTGKPISGNSVNEVMKKHSLI